MRRRVRLDLVLGAAVVIVVVAAVLIEQGSASSHTGAPKTPPKPVAVAFTHGYLSYLDGSLAAAALPQASPRVKTIAAGAPPIPPADRAGPIQLTGVRMTYVSGATVASATMLDRDRTHSFDFEISLRYVSGRWQVTYLVPPDLSTLLATRTPAAPTPPAVRLAAEHFAVAYGDYREGSTRTPPAGAPQVVSEIATGQDPLAGTTPTHSHAAVVSIAFGPVARGAVSATAVLKVAGKRLRFGFDLEQSGGRWQALGFPEGS